MCTSFTISNDKSFLDLATWHDFSGGQLTGSLTIMPKQHASLLVPSNDDNSYGLVSMAWGFQLSPTDVLSQGSTPSLTGKYINARWENLAISNLWKDSYLNRRAVLAITSFYHRDNQYVMTNSDVMYFAAVYASNVRSRFAIVSRPSYGIVQAQHPRCPMLLTEEGIRIWLDKDLDVHILETFTTFAALHYKPSLTLLS